MVVGRYLWTGLHGYNSLQKHPPRLGWLHLNRKYKNSLQNHQKHMRKHLSIELFAYYLPFFLLSLSLSCFLCFTSSRSTLHLHAAINPSTFQCLYWNSTKEKPGPANQQATATLCTLPSHQTTAWPFASFRRTPSWSSSVQRQEYDVRHSILVPGSDALRPKLATKAALKCLQRAEGGGWKKEKLWAKTCGFFDDIEFILLILETHQESKITHFFFFFWWTGKSSTLKRWQFFSKKREKHESADSHFVGGTDRGQRWAKSELWTGELEKTEGMKPHVLLDSLKACGFRGEHRFFGSLGWFVWKVVLTHRFGKKHAAPVCLGCYN